MTTLSSPFHSEGDKVEVLFSRDDPRKFVIDTFRMVWGDFAVLLAIGAGFLGAGVAPMVASFSRGRARAEIRIALGIVIPLVLAGATLFALFAPWPVQVIVGGALVYIAFHAVRARRRYLASQRRSAGG